MDKVCLKRYIAQTPDGGQLITDMAQGYQSWATWSIGLCTAALGLILLAKLAQFVVNSVRG